MTDTPSTPKDLALEAVRNLPEDSTTEDIVREILILRMIERGTADSDAGRVISHEQMKELVAQWRQSGGQAKRKTG